VILALDQWQKGYFDEWQTEILICISTSSLDNWERKLF